jgi:hypothetical protein
MKVNQLQQHIDIQYLRMYAIHSMAKHLQIVKKQTLTIFALNICSTIHKNKSNLSLVKQSSLQLSIGRYLLDRDLLILYLTA